MKWQSLPYRDEEPCKQATEYFHQIVTKSELTACLNALSRQGFTEIYYDENSADIDETYQEPDYTVTAERIVCACKARINYLKAE